MKLFYYKIYIMNKYEKEYESILKRIIKKYGNNETYSDTLFMAGKSYFGNKFIGVFSSDKIPKLLKNQMAIINLDKSNNSGSHWVAIVKNSKKIYLYDSFGRKVHKILPSLLSSNNGVVIETEEDKEQEIDEENCGQRCLAFLKIFDKYNWIGAKHI